MELWDHVGEDLLLYIIGALMDGKLEDSIKYGITSITPKGDSLSLIKNLRPILVLTALYKLIAKVLANRIKPILPDCALPTQTAFVKNRCILDNVFLAREAIGWATESGQDVVIMLLDFEKAYDRVN